MSWHTLMSRGGASVLLAVLFTALPLMLARAETIAIVCEDTDKKDPYPPMTFQIDLGAQTVQHRNATTSYNVPARISAQSIDWNWGTNRHTLDRASGILHRIVDAQYQTTWQCRKVAGLGI